MLKILAAATLASAVTLAAGSDALQSPKADRSASLFRGKPITFWAAQLKDKDPDFRRRAAYALGMFGKEAALYVPALIALLGDKTPVEWVKADYIGNVHLEAVNALIKIQTITQNVVDALARAARQEQEHPHQPDPGRAMWVLTQLGAPGLRALISILDDHRAAVARRALTCLAGAKWGPEAKAALPALEKLTEHNDEDVRRMAEKVIGQITRTRWKR